MKTLIVGILVLLLLIAGCIRNIRESHRFGCPVKDPLGRIVPPLTQSSPIDQRSVGVCGDVSFHE